MEREGRVGEGGGAGKCIKSQSVLLAADSSS